MGSKLESASSQENPVLIQISTMISPRDYTIYPLSKDMAVLSMSRFLNF